MADRLGLVELILVFGAVLALAVIELVRTRRASGQQKREPSKSRED